MKFLNINCKLTSLKNFFIFKIVILTTLFFVSINAWAVISSGHFYNEVSGNFNLPQTFSTPFYLTNQEQTPRIKDREIIERENSDYFRYNIGVDPDTDLPYNYTFIKPDGEVEIGFYTTPTDIGYYFAYLVGVAKGDIDNEVMNPDDAMDRLQHALEVLKDSPKKDGLLYWYNILPTHPEVSPDFDFISAIDNAFYAASLGLIVGAFVDDSSEKAKNLVSLAKELLYEQKEGWRNLYDEEKELLLGGYFGEDDKVYYSDSIYNEGRLATLMAIVLGDVPDNAWKNLEENYMNYTFTDGETKRVLAPWESAFQAWMPLVFVPEMDWSPEGFKLAHQRYARVQADWANRENMPAFYSECSNPYSKEEYEYLTGIGIPGASVAWQRGNPIRSDIGSVYATGLVYAVDPDLSIDFFNKLLSRYPEIKGPFGWRDSVGLAGDVSNAYVGKNQSVLLSALNANNNHKYFVKFLEEFGKLDYVKKLYQERKFSLH